MFRLLQENMLFLPIKVSDYFFLKISNIVVVSLNSHIYLHFYYLYSLWWHVSSQTQASHSISDPWMGTGHQAVGRFPVSPF